MAETSECVCVDQFLVIFFIFLCVVIFMYGNESSHGGYNEDLECPRISLVPRPHTGGTSLSSDLLNKTIGCVWPNPDLI